MLVHIPKILDGAGLGEAVAAFDRLDFGSGAATAGWHAKGVKNNRQALNSPELAKLQSKVLEALAANAVFRSLTLPSRFAQPLVSRYSGGENYGTHVDDALMGRDSPMRTDVSVTVFLCDPASYEGGELIAETLSGEACAKYPAGDAVIYPATTLHRVAPVTKGERRVAVTWVQSRIRDAEKRELLYDLDRARRQVFDTQGKCEAFDLMAKTYANLLRQWVEV